MPRKRIYSDEERILRVRQRNSQWAKNNRSARNTIWRRWAIKNKGKLKAYQVSNKVRRNALAKKNRKIKSLKHKTQLIESLGGKCNNCGYDKCLTALEFHHKNPKMKSFAISGLRLYSIPIARLLIEAKKCLLLCGNCHRELHYDG